MIYVGKYWGGDALASVDGFRMMVMLTLQHLFGVRFCPNCPDCNVGSCSCQVFFWTAMPRLRERFLAVSTRRSSPSTLKNLLGVLFIQCLHQHTSLHENLKKLRVNGSEIVSAYLDYKAHVCRQVYHTEEAELEALTQFDIFEFLESQNKGKNRLTGVR